MKNIIHVLVGLPASGKSTYAENELNSNHIFSSDDYRMKLYGRLDADSKNKKIFNVLYQDMAKTLNSSSGIEVVFDATNLNRKLRAQFYQRFNKHEIIIHFFAINLSELIERNKSHSIMKFVSNSRMNFLYKTLQVPRIGVDCDQIKVIGNYESFKEEFDIDLPHDSPYHAESLGEHLEMAIELAKREPDSERMQEIAKFHDLGKFVARNKNTKDTPHAEFFRSINNGEFYNYYQHQNISAFYYLAYINEQVDLSNLDSNKTQEKIENLEVIYQHMQAHSGFSQKMIDDHKLTAVELDLLERFERIDTEARIIDQDILDKYLEIMNDR